MPLILLFLTAFLTALSGALMPGPVLFVTLRHSAAGGRGAGPLVVAGHALVEVPLVAAIVLGLRELLRGDVFLGTVGLAGGAVLLLMSASMLRSLPTLHLPGPDEAREDGVPGAMGVVAAGAATSLSNPYFFLWWATIGMGLLAKAAPYALWVTPSSTSATCWRTSCGMRPWRSPSTAAAKCCRTGPTALWWVCWRYASPVSRSGSRGAGRSGSSDGDRRRPCLCGEGAPACGRCRVARCSLCVACRPRPSEPANGHQSGDAQGI